MKRREERSDPVETWEGYTVRDDYGWRIGKVRSACLVEAGAPEFFAVRLGFFVESRRRFVPEQASG